MEGECCASASDALVNGMHTHSPKVMEELVHKRTVFSLGIAGLDQPKLQELYDWSLVTEKQIKTFQIIPLPLSKVKPKVMQVNLPDCCTMPEVRTTVGS